MDRPCHLPVTDPGLGDHFRFGTFINLEQRLPGKTKTEGHAILLVQDEREKGDADPHMLQVWREIQRKLTNG